MQGCRPAFSRLLPALPALLEEIWGGLAHVCWQSWQSWQESNKSWQASTSSRRDLGRASPCQLAKLARVGKKPASKH